MPTHGDVRDGAFRSRFTPTKVLRPLRPSEEETMDRRTRTHGWTRLTLAIVLGLAVLVAGSVVAYAKGGTAKPPAGAVSPFITPTLPDPVFTTATADIHGFDETGFIQDATVSADNSACPDVSNPHNLGGTVTINNTNMVVPCNMIVQMPANTLTWADMVNGGPSLALKDSPFPSFEVRVVGNIVAGTHMAGLMFASQQSANTGSGIISKIDYDTGRIHVDTGDPANPAVLEINDPNGRFGRKQSPTRASASTTRTRRSTPAPATRCASHAPTRRAPTTRCARRPTGPSPPARAATAATSPTPASSRCPPAAS
jgi:hypothetical protein